MNGFLSIRTVVCLLVSSLSFGLVVSQESGEDGANTPATNTGLYVKEVDPSGLPYVLIRIENVTCPPESAHGIFGALQMFGYDDSDRFEFYGDVLCSEVTDTWLDLDIFIDNDKLAYHPENPDQFVYVDYAVAYAWLGEVSNQGYSDSPQHSRVDFAFPEPTQRPKRSASVDFSPSKPIVCDAEPEIFDVLKFPVVFENRGQEGVVVTFSNFSSLSLQMEAARTPRFSIAVVLFLAEHCLPTTTLFCSILHAIRGNEDEDTPQLFLTRHTNELVLQVVDDESNSLVSYKSGLLLVPGMAHQVLVSLDNWYYTITISSWDPSLPPSSSTEQSHDSSFDRKIRVTSASWPGYIVVGGSDYFRSFSGFIDSTTVFRRRFAFPHDSPVLSRKKLSPIGQLLALRLNHCDQVRAALSSYQLQNPLKLDRSEDGRKLNLNVEKIADLLVKSNASDEIYVRALSSLEGSSSEETVLEAIDQLSLAGCLGSSSAELLLGVVRKYKFPNGNGSTFEPPAVNYLRASLLGDHMADLVLGNALMTGSQSLVIPKDEAAAFRYLKAAAGVSQQATAIHSSTDRWIDSVHLHDEDELASHQESDDSPIIAWLLYQAGMGDAEAAHDVARLFYQGARGVDRDMVRAAELFRQAANADADPELLYDYAIVLLHGRGVKQDKIKALELLHRAADANFGPAYGAIGWYYMEKDGGNLSLAVPYLEKAAELGVPEAAHNIGFLLLNSMHPFNPGKHTGLAYGYFVKAAGLGSLEGALLASEFVARGIPSIDLQPNISEACRFAQTVANQSPRLGVPLRAAIQGFVSGRMQKAFLHYALAAETGNEVAIFNVGFLCETESLTLIKSRLINDNDHAKFCANEMFELSLTKTNVQGHSYLWLARNAVEKGDLDTAASYYADALLLGNDEGYFGLAWLAASFGYHIPLGVFWKLVVGEDKSFAYSLAQLEPVEVATFFLEACMTIEEKEKSYDEDGYELEDETKSLPEGYFSCALYLYYIKANQTVQNTITSIPLLSTFLHSASGAHDEIASALGGDGSTSSRLEALSNLFSFQSDLSVALFFVVGFIFGVTVIYPLISALWSMLFSVRWR